MLGELSVRARTETARDILLVSENEPQRSEHLLPLKEGGFGLDGMWNDDFHHSARVALTGRHDGYMHDYRGRAQEFVSAVRHGFLFQGQYYRWQKQPRGSPVTTQAAWSFVIFTQNHDQVANTLHGARIHALTSPARYRAMTALMLLAPQTPLLFMGQEFAASAPFPFFADQGAALAPAVHAGRREFVSQFESYAQPHAQQSVPDPSLEATFRSAKLDHGERGKHKEMLALHRDLIALRRSDPVIAAQDWKAIDGAVLSDQALLLRWSDARHGGRLLLVNFGIDRVDEPMPEPLMALPRGSDWELAWCSEDVRYGGLGARPPLRADGWSISGECAVLLTSTGTGRA